MDDVITSLYAAKFPSSTIQPESEPWKLEWLRQNSTPLFVLLKHSLTSPTTIFMEISLWMRHMIDYCRHERELRLGAKD
jgi:hypothetical protein